MKITTLGSKLNLKLLATTRHSKWLTVPSDVTIETSLMMIHDNTEADDESHENDNQNL